MNASHWAALGLVVLASAGCAATTPGQPVAAATPAETGRDWSRIDTDKDGHVSPAEMEKFLAENPGPLRK